MVLIVSASSKAQTVSDFIAMARANRGGLNYASVERLDDRWDGDHIGGSEIALGLLVRNWPNKAYGMIYL